MPGLMTLRPMAAASKARRGTSGLSEKIAEERNRAAAPTLTQFRSSRMHPINMPSFRPPVQSNAQTFRYKQVTDPLPENVRARLINSGVDGERENYSSSGSEHEPSSMCLAAMVHEFVEEGEAGKCGRARCNCETGSCNGGASSNDEDDTRSSLGGELSEILQGTASCVSARETTLLANVTKALNTIEGDKTDKEEYGSTGCTRRIVMKQLQESGYNAAICKSRWDHAGSFPGGDYEYIDVLFESSKGVKERLIVDIDFQSQFNIARPTSEYKCVIRVLPSVYVGTTDRLQQILNMMCDAVKRSLRKNSMFLPPWRKPEYMKAKWFSSYKRTTNEASQSKEVGSESLVQNISSIAVRGTGWNKKFTDIMELEFERVGSRQVMQEMRNGMEQSLRVTNKTPVKTIVEDLELEGVVRGANRLQYLLGKDVKNDTSKETRETVTDWQPPAPLPRVSVRPRGATGLTSILREAGLVTSNPNNRTTLEEVCQGQRTSLAMAM